MLSFVKYVSKISKGVPLFLYDINSNNPENYRPITCLPTLYKILAFFLSGRSYVFLKRMNYSQLSKKDTREKVKDVKTSC